MNTFAAEWIKLRSIRSTWWYAGGALAAMLAVACLTADGDARDLRAAGALPGSVEATANAVTAIGWLHFILGAFGILAMTSEFATRGIVSSLTCTPSRTRLLLAKVAVVALAVLAWGLVTSAIGTAASAPLLREFARFDAGEIAVRLLASAVDLALIAVLALGLGTLIRRSAGALTVLFVLILVVPPILGEAAEPLHLPILATIADYTPANAGSRFIGGEWQFGLILAAWSAAALMAGWWALRSRDA